MTFKILKLHKPLGVTPIQLWLSYRSRIFLPNMKAIESQRLPKGAICGKLDPMAEGELIILIEGDWIIVDPSIVTVIPYNMQIVSKIEGESNLRFGEVMKTLCNHEKIYEFGLVIGISTDSDDRLGIIEDVTKDSICKKIVKNVEKELLQYAQNLKEQEYHVYSAKTVQGQSLWWWKKQGRIQEIEIPRHECYIKEIEVLEETVNRPSQMSFDQFINKTISDLQTNRENLMAFDIDKIIDNWSNFQGSLHTLHSEHSEHPERSEHSEHPVHSEHPGHPVHSVHPGQPGHPVHSVHPVKQLEHPVKQLEDLKIINVRVRVTTGTFIRQICRDLIRKSGIPMLCSYIDRKCVILNNE